MNRQGKFWQGNDWQGNQQGINPEYHHRHQHMNNYQLGLAAIPCRSRRGKEADLAKGITRTGPTLGKRLMEVVELEPVPAIEPALIAANPVPQVSKPAVSPISKSAACETGWHVRTWQGTQVWKPAIQQTWKSAVRPPPSILPPLPPAPPQSRSRVVRCPVVLCFVVSLSVVRGLAVRPHHVSRFEHATSWRFFLCIRQRLEASLGKL